MYVRHLFDHGKLHGKAVKILAKEVPLPNTPYMEISKGWYPVKTKNTR